MKIFIISIAMILCGNALAEGNEHGHDAGEEKEALKLSDKATKNFGIKVQKVVPKNSKAEVPTSALVESKDKKQIFVFHEGKYEAREVRIVKRTASSVTIEPLAEAEDVVVSGVNYLKVVEMSHGEEGGGGHGH